MTRLNHLRIRQVARANSHELNFNFLIDRLVVVVVGRLSLELVSNLHFHGQC